MKKFYLLILMTSIFMMSCGGHFFNPRYYYNKKDSSSGSEQAPPVDVGGGDENIPEDQDPFKNGEWNSIDYIFNGNKILDFLFGASFDNNNVPIYKFYKDGKSWSVTDPFTSEKYFDGTDGGNVAQGYKISPAKFYRYDYKNPLVTPESSYNQSTRMGRFVFYRLVGEAVIVPLNNYLIAVDTYSKLVFAYGKITKTEKETLTGKLYPVAFEAVELYGDKRPFYEYDPIGFMSYDASTDSLTLTLYREYQNEMAKDANAYFPQVHDSSRAVAGYDNANSAGRSPYYMVNVNDIDPQTIIDQFKGKTYGIRDRLTLYTYKFSPDGLTLTLTVDHFYDGIVTKTYQYSKEVVGATSLKYGELTITGLGTYDRMKDGTREYILDYQDNGPAFVDRVAGKTYKAADGSYEYRFSPDGNTIQYYENSSLVDTYTFSAEYKDSDKAEYKVNLYWGFKLANTKGNKDDTLYRSLGGSPIAGATSVISHQEGYLNMNIIAGGFIENVKGKTYKFRDYSEYNLSNPLPNEYQSTGKSLTLYTYEFTANGQTLNITEQVWRGETKTTSYTVQSSTDNSAVYGYNGSTIEFSIKYDNETLYRGDQAVGTASFVDEGPIFLDRVKDNPTYKYGNNTYVFKDDGKTIEWNGNTWKLYRYDNESEYKYRAIYVKENTMWFDNYYGVELTYNDDVIKSTPASTEGTIQWWLLGDEAYREK
ncbi:hypothetical protein R4J17_07280 [Brachyspira intermedia]|uniref:hypothetical protein n=1 Tax=Brachyspira intermedia TaxID=84377 RepID=UPI003006E7B0